MGSFSLAALILVASFSASQLLRSQPADAQRIAELFEDDAEALLKKLTNPTGDAGEGRVEKDVVFSGKASIKIIPTQRFHPRILGWKFRIAKAPKADEFRYLRFAWKADGCQGIMVQLHDEKDWHIRYTAGIDQFNWGTRFVAAKPSTDWKLITCDLYKDFGERTITGMALTVFGGQAGYDVDDLDRIDATGLRRGKPPAPSAGDLDQLWRQLSDGDDSRNYRAFWTMVAAPRQSIPYVKAKLTAPAGKVDAQQLRRWIAELGDEQFPVRENATRMLAQHVDAAAPLLEQELTRKPSPEARTRIGQLLRGRKGVDAERQRTIELLNVGEKSGPHRHSVDIRQPSWDQVEDAIRALNEHTRNDLYLQPDASNPETYLAVGGGRGRYLVTGGIDNERFPTAVNEAEDSPGRELLVVGGQVGDYPRNWVLDLDTALRAVRSFFDSGDFAGCGVS